MRLKNIRFLITIIIFFTSYSIVACPLKIINNKNLGIFIIDSYNNQAVFLKPGRSAIIDPTINNWQKHFRKETFDVYYQEKSNSSNYFRRYHVTENFCTDDPAKNQIKISQFEKFIQTSDKRFSVKAVPRQKIRIKHEHGVHKH